MVSLTFPFEIRAEPLSWVKKICGRDKQFSVIEPDIFKEKREPIRQEGKKEFFQRRFVFRLTGLKKDFKLSSTWYNQLCFSYVCNNHFRPLIPPFKEGQT